MNTRMTHLPVMLSDSGIRSRVTYIAAGLLWGVFVSYSSDQIPAKRQDHPIAIVGATIHTVSGPTIEKGQFSSTRGRSLRSERT